MTNTTETNHSLRHQAQTAMTIGEYIAQHGAQELYNVGQNWVGRDDDGTLCEFPATEGGWDRRRPYAGPATQPVFIANAIGTGYPKWERPKAN